MKGILRPGSISYVN